MTKVLTGISDSRPKGVSITSGASSSVTWDIPAMNDSSTPDARQQTGPRAGGLEPVLHLKLVVLCHLHRLELLLFPDDAL